MRKKEILELIKKECFKLEEKYDIPIDVDWEDIMDDEDATYDVCIELAYNCLLHFITEEK